MGMDGKVTEKVTQYIRDPAKIQAFLDAVQKGKNDYFDLCEKITEKYARKAKHDLKEICDEVVYDDFYDEYDPLVYKRREGLKKGYEIIIDGWNWDIDTESKFLPGYYHQRNEIVFNNVFMEGYHGGSRGTDKSGVSRNVPSWRWPSREINTFGVKISRFSRWHTASVPQSDSIDERIDIERGLYIERMKAVAQAEFDKEVDKIVDFVTDAYNAISR